MAWLKDAVPLDAFHYHLELTNGAKGKEERQKADWYDNTRNLLPRDLNALADVVSQAKGSIIKKCREAKTNNYTPGDAT